MRTLESTPTKYKDVIHTIVTCPYNFKWLVATSLIRYPSLYIPELSTEIKFYPTTKVFAFSGYTDDALPIVDTKVYYIRVYKKDENPRMGHAYAVKRILEGEIKLNKNSYLSYLHEIEPGEEDY